MEQNAPFFAINAYVQCREIMHGREAFLPAN